MRSPVSAVPRKREPVVGELSSKITREIWPKSLLLFRSNPMTFSFPGPRPNSMSPPISYPEPRPWLSKSRNEPTAASAFRSSSLVDSFLLWLYCTLRLATVPLSPVHFRLPDRRGNSPLNLMSTSRNSVMLPTASVITPMPPAPPRPVPCVYAAFHSMLAVEPLTDRSPPHHEGSAYFGRWIVRHSYRPLMPP